ncbi:hypothetical protein E2C01_092306 [Portunus trituberculatus]|uniref:Uncharacterized protein n=1 Tax=Portunus trituberculatus TaxID=210409 RepID=A0A5B7JVF7_PORTR|nr:hypothetical protein [Portunus trituberculatus]
MDEFPTTPELKPEIDQNQTSEEPSDRDLYLDTRRYLEGVRERTRNRLLDRGGEVQKCLRIRAQVLTWHKRSAAINIGAVKYRCCIYCLV